MSYLGNPIISTDFPKDTFSGNGATAFTMSIAPASVNAVIVIVSGVTQDPSTYTISGTTLTFSAAPPSGTSNISVRHLGVAGTPNTPSAGSVGPSAINSSYSLWNLSGSDVNYTAGNVGVGTTSPLGKLHINQSGGVAAISQTYAVANFQNSFGGGGDAMITLTGSNQGIIAALNASQSAVPMTFYTGQTERMRINASGQVLVNTTSASGAGEIFSSAVSANSTAACFVATNTGQTSDVALIRANRNTTNGSYRALAYYNDAAGSYKFWVLDSGNCQNTNGSYGSFSDIKLKENISDATPKLEDLSRVRVVSYNLKSNPTEKHIGVIAQELEQVFPAMVEEIADKDGDNNDLGTTTKSVKYSIFVPMLIKAIQELNAKVDAQALEIQALKGTV